MTTPLQINRYDRLVRRLMNLVGEGALVTGVLPDVFPTIDVESLETDAWALVGWKPAMGGASLTGAVGERPHIQLLNPGGSGMIAVLEVVIISGTPGGTLRFNIHDTILTTADPSARWRDRRIATLSFPVMQPREQSVAGNAIVAPMEMSYIDSTVIMWEPPKGFMTLVPGTGVAFNHSENASRLTMAFFWRERLLEEAEQNI